MIHQVPCDSLPSWFKFYEVKVFLVYFSLNMAADAPK